jgi:hypothetical protein
VPSSGNQSQENSRENRQENRQQNRGIDWPAIVRTLLVQVVVLLALAGAFVGYINWSSDAVWAEFIEASKPSVREPGPREPGPRPPSSLPVRAVKGQAPCNPKG